MAYASTAATPQLTGVTSNGIKSVSISSGSTPPFVLNWDVTALTDANLLTCVDPVAILAGTATNHANVQVFNLGDAGETRAGSQLLIRAGVAHSAAPTIGGTLKVGAIGRFPPRSPGLSSLKMPHEIVSAFPTVDPEAGSWLSLADINGGGNITVPLPSATLPDMTITVSGKTFFCGAYVRVPLFGAMHVMCPIRSVMTLSAGSGVLIGQIVN